MNPLIENQLLVNRREFFGRSAAGLGALGLASLLPGAGAAPSKPQDGAGRPITHVGLPEIPHYAPKAKRVIYMFQSGAPSQMDLFDYKPKMAEMFDKDLPDSIRQGQRLTTMSSGQKRFPIAPSIYKFKQHGKSGAWLSELLPHTAKVADDIAIIKSMHTDQINHDPAMTFFQTGHQLAGRPSMGAWLSYGLGSENDDLPAFVAMSSRGTGRPNCQPLYDRLWGAGFMPSSYGGVKFRGKGDPVLYLTDPKGMDRSLRRRMLDDVNAINQKSYEELGDPEIQSRIAQYEMAYRMQMSVPGLTDLSDEPQHTFDMYGENARKPGTYAYNALMARRLSERGVRFVQMFHQGWDQHGNLAGQLPGQCKDADQASSALVQDLKQRGLLDETLVLWGGEFGRTIYSQGKLTPTNYGRDHHPRCFSMWMAGGGIKGGQVYGETDDFSYNIVENPTSIHDMHATMLHLLGIDHERLTSKFQGRHYRLTDVHGELVRDLLM